MPPTLNPLTVDIRNQLIKILIIWQKPGKNTHAHNYQQTHNLVRHGVNKASILKPQKAYSVYLFLSYESCKDAVRVHTSYFILQPSSTSISRPVTIFMKMTQQGSLLLNLEIMGHAHLFSVK